MKLHELFEKKLLLEDVTLNISRLTAPGDLRDPKTSEYYTEVVNVNGDVALYGYGLSRLPVKFGKVSGDFGCDINQLTSLEGVPHTVRGNFDCGSNKLTSLEGIHKLIKKINGIIVLSNNPNKSGGIGLILIEGLTGIIKSWTPAGASSPFEIIERYLGQGKKGLLLCQEELIEAGYEEYARL